MTNRHFDTATMRERDQPTVSLCQPCYDQLCAKPDALHLAGLSGRGSFPCGACGKMSDIMTRHIVLREDLREPSDGEE